MFLGVSFSIWSVRDSPGLAPAIQEEVRCSKAQEAGHRRHEEEQEEVRLGLRRCRRNRRYLQARYAIADQFAQFVLSVSKFFFFSFFLFFGLLNFFFWDFVIVANLYLINLPN